MDGLLGVAGMIITSDYGSFPKIPSGYNLHFPMGSLWFSPAIDGYRFHILPHGASVPALSATSGAGEASGEATPRSRSPRSGSSTWWDVENHPVLLGALWIVTGWWLTYPSEKYEFVNGVGIIPYILEKIKNVPNHQPGELNMKDPNINGDVRNKLGSLIYEWK